MARGQADMHRMIRPSASIVIFEPLPQSMSGDADDGIHLRVEGFRATQGVYCDAVFLDFVDSSFEVFFTNKGEEPDMIVCPSQYARRQYVFYFSSFGFQFADCRLQVDPPKKGPSEPLRTYTPLL